MIVGSEDKHPDFFTRNKLWFESHTAAVEKIVNVKNRTKRRRNSHPKKSRDKSKVTCP